MTEVLSEPYLSFFFFNLCIVSLPIVCAEVFVLQLHTLISECKEAEQFSLV